MPCQEKSEAHGEMIDALSRVFPEMMKQAKEEATDMSKARDPHSLKSAILNQDPCADISAITISWFSGIEYCTEFVSKMGQKITNLCYLWSLALVCECFYWSTFLQNVTNWEKYCK